MLNSKLRAILVISAVSGLILVLSGFKLLGAILLMVFLYFSFKTSHTQHGFLDYRTALSLHLLTFRYRLKPDPDIDFHLRIPVNLLYPLSALLPNEAVHKTKRISVDGGEGEIPAKVYWPNHTAEITGSLPVIVYFHGGGFVVGSVDIFDDVARTLSNSTRSIVVSVEYRLAPKHPYPAAIDDGFAAVNWVYTHAKELGADPKKLFVAGDSAGATIASVVSLRALESSDLNIVGQILYYPATDLRGTPYESVVNFGDGFGLTQEMMDGFFEAYVGHIENKDDLAHPHISPLLSNQHSGLPPTFIITAGFDPLHNSGELYAKKLKEHNIPVTYHDYKSMMHGFISIRFFPQRREAFTQTGRFVDNILMRT